MARADRLERLEAQREEAEAEYRDALIAALRVTAAGQWGLFDHQQDRHARAKAAPMLAELNELAETINDMREKLGMEEFDLHAEFLSQRGPVRSDAVGEPKKAAAWLQRLGA
ncbi:hypothetical protein [Novosphingobium humi]|uniref:Uncharacterized protein n=1 Tax=Novosphingobium humi TaxID=2282397 RepID=A0ABY7U1B7_9SPHN|nr:hypothetical protein [Novosphingobium humi]WCT77919.1 hypothetical protein PQ457_02795 [Novosphingobium humi]WJS98572.1 hypothetical protein NYQ05_15875 [Novosphingobium humi]